MKPADMLTAVVFAGENYRFYFGPRRAGSSGYVKWPKYTDPLAAGYGDIDRIKAITAPFDDVKEGEWGWFELGMRPREYSASACTDS